MNVHERSRTLKALPRHWNGATTDRSYTVYKPLPRSHVTVLEAKMKMICLQTKGAGRVVPAASCHCSRPTVAFAHLGEAFLANCDLAGDILRRAQFEQSARHVANNSGWSKFMSRREYTHVIHDRRCMPIDSRTPTIPGRSKSGFIHQENISCTKWEAPRGVGQVARRASYVLPVTNREEERLAHG